MKKIIIKKSYIYALLIFIFGILFVFNYYQYNTFKKTLESGFCYNGFSVANILFRLSIQEEKIVFDFLSEGENKIYEEFSNSYPSFSKFKDNNKKVIFKTKKQLPSDIKLSISQFDTDDYYYIDYANENLNYYKYINDKKWIVLSIFNNNYFEEFGLLSQNQTTRHIITSVFLIISFLTLQYIFSKEEFSKFSQENLSKMEEVAHTDKLTGIANRVKGDLALQKNIELAKRLNQKFAIIFFDIDYFKSVNDKFGHDIGDMALKNISNLVTSSCRNDDIFIRWGGEEFLIILPNANLNQAMKFANRLRENIQNAKIIPQRQITCSFGVLEYQENDDKEKMIKQVDKLLYKAKNQGRNIVIG